MLRALPALIVVALSAGALGAGEPIDPVARHHQALKSAWAQKDWPAALQHARAMAELLPRSTRVRYNLACALALNGQRDEAVETLDGLADRGVLMDAAADEDLASLRDMPAFQKVLARFDALKQPIGKARVAFRLPDKDLVTEGIAHDPKTGDFFVSSVHRRKIVRVRPDGSSRDFATAGLDAVLGLQLDPASRTLWACSSAVPEMAGYVEKESGGAAVVAFDVDSGRERRRLGLPGSGAHNCNDLVLAADGTLYVSDPAARTIYAAAPGSAELVALVPAGLLASPQGLALSADQRSIFVADYPQGILRVDRTTGAVQLLDAPADSALGGIDGLLRHGDDLLAIQNGIRPHRVLRLQLAGDRISRVEVLERSHPEFDEPTLGTIVGETLYFVANSQWGAFTEGKIWPEEKLKQPVVLKLPLD